MSDVDTCPTCGQGKVEDGVVSLPNECCAIYFSGEHTWAHAQWVTWTKYLSGELSGRKAHLSR